MIEPTKEDIGRGVIYTPSHVYYDKGHKDCEQGYITSFNKHCVFVRYGAGITSAGTNRKYLFWEHKS